MVIEAVGKKIVYKRVDPGNAKQIEDASFCEREGFGTGLDPQELPPVLAWIAGRGDIVLQYAVEKKKHKPNGVIEFIPLLEALKYRSEDIEAGEFDLSISPFDIIMKNQERVFADVRRFAKDENVVYHHGIAMARRGKGYGTRLMACALANPRVNRTTIVCFPDAAQINKETKVLELAPNEDSFTLHLKAGFILVGVVDPPVYDETLTYFSFIRPPDPIVFFEVWEQRIVNLAEDDAKSILNKVRQLTKEGFVGHCYNKETHEMVFSNLTHSNWLG